MPRGDGLAGAGRAVEPQKPGNHIGGTRSNGFDRGVGVHNVALEPITEGRVFGEPLARACMQLVLHSDEVGIWALCYVEGLGDLFHLGSVVLELVRNVYDR